MFSFQVTAINLNVQRIKIENLTLQLSELAIICEKKSYLVNIKAIILKLKALKALTEYLLKWSGF